MSHAIDPTWADYALLDSGNGRKLEKWGDYFLIRPETAAIWKPKMEYAKWTKKAHAIYEYENKRSGKWNIVKKVPKKWVIEYPLADSVLKFKIELTKFKHVGLFPEQAENWEYIYQRLSSVANAKVLNLFAYTGGATLAAKSTGAQVTHVDAIKQVITWSNENMQASGLKDVRWIVEDALKFAQKEVKRNSKYDMVILDPPTWGLGPKGEKWKLEDKLHELFSNVSKIVNDKGTVIVNTYSGLTPTMMQNVAQKYFPKSKIDAGELLMRSEKSFDIPTGTVLRIEI